MFLLRKISLIKFCLVFGVLSAQDFDAEIAAVNDFSIKKDFVKLSAENKELLNTEVLEDFFEKLYQLDLGKKSKVRIVHIGDSHIQAGFFTGKNRTLFQERFGNAGLGFTFPYNLANTNGIKEVTYSSSVPWEGKRNIFAKEIDSIGVSGFGLTTKFKDFAVNLKIKDEKYYFNTLKLLTPKTANFYVPAKTNKPISFKKYTIERKTHLIKSGEALSIIAQKYGVGIADIKKANNLHSNAIRAGDKLIIPVKSEKPQPVNHTDFQILNFDKNQDDFVLHSEKAMESIWFLANGNKEKYSLNGFVLENDQPGVIYSGIGVNGARFADYNKTSLFFDELKTLAPDLLIISLGTNEAHDNLEKEKYKERLQTFIKNIRKNHPDIPILFTTPPPSLLKRQFPNTYEENYTSCLKNLAGKENFAVWDLFSVLGGKNLIRENFSKGIISKDYVHYSEKGYQYSAELFNEAIMYAYYLYTQNKQSR